jgi:thiol:disulfide interchange protein DsbD
MKKKQIRVSGFFLLIWLLLVFGHAESYSSPKHVQAQLIVEVESIRPGSPFCVALALKMEEGWHTYWQNPGDSGLPTTIEWDLPDGFSAGKIQWPYPKKFETSGIVTFGYADEVFLLTDIRAPASLKPGTVVKISASADWLTCKEECVPEHAELSTEIPVKDLVPNVDPKWADYFDMFRNNLPKLFGDWDVHASVTGSTIVIQASPRVTAHGPMMDVFFFPEQEGIFEYAEPQTVKKRGNGYSIEIKRSKSTHDLPSRLKGILYSSQGWDSSGQILALLVDVPLRME